MKPVVLLLAASVCFQVSDLNAQDKVVLQEPNQQEVLQKLKAEPEGVLWVKINEDGSFKSLVVKGGAGIEEVLDSQKGKQLARQEAEIQCKKYLAQFLKENINFVGGDGNVLTIVTKNELAKDAAGNAVKLGNTQSLATKSVIDSESSFSRATLRGLTVVSSEVSNEKDGSKFTLIMALTQKSLNQVTAVAKALSSSTVNKPGTSESETDRPNPETKVNPDALNDLR